MELIAQAQMVLPWAEAGIVGACIGSLVLIIRRMFEFFEDLQQRHAAERDSWLASEEKRSERLERAISELSSAIRERFKP